MKINKSLTLEKELSDKILKLSKENRRTWNAHALWLMEKGIEAAEKEKEILNKEELK